MRDCGVSKDDVAGENEAELGAGDIEAQRGWTGGVERDDIEGEQLP